MKRLIPQYLDPASRLGEILFGLIMVLTVTLTAGLTVAEDQGGVRQLLATAIGCNLAWGIIDGVMYVMNCITVRSGKMQLVQEIRNAKDQETALALVEADVEPELQRLLGPEKAEAFNKSILKHIVEARVAPATMTKDDIYGALACFFLVFVSCLPATIPFLIFSQPHFALRISNGLSIALLFLVGHKWGHYARANRMVAGLVMVGIGLLLVALAILLGG